MAATSETWTVGRLLGWTANYLKERGSESARLDAEVLLAYARQCARITLYTEFDAPVDLEVRDRYRSLIRRRAEGAPVAYLVGRKEFFSLELEVSPAVLIPRPESEFVVMQFLALAKGLEAPGVADLGTGSGNLAIAAARHHPSARVTATDVSPDALELASRNAQRHGVADRIQFVRSDLLAELPEDAVFHFILSNPPYVASEDIERLPTGVRDFEPRIALDGGPGGTAVVERLIRQASRHLAPSGYLILEIGAPQEQAVRELIAAREFEPTQTARDYSGHPRVVWARKRAR